MVLIISIYAALAWWLCGMWFANQIWREYFTLRAWNPIEIQDEFALKLFFMALVYGLFARIPMDNFMWRKYLQAIKHS